MFKRILFLALVLTAPLHVAEAQANPGSNTAEATASLSKYQIYSKIRRHETFQNNIIALFQDEKPPRLTFFKTFIARPIYNSIPLFCAASLTCSYLEKSNEATIKRAAILLIGSFLFFRDVLAYFCPCNSSDTSKVRSYLEKLEQCAPDEFQSTIRKIAAQEDRITINECIALAMALYHESNMALKRLYKEHSQTI